MVSVAPRGMRWQAPQKSFSRSALRRPGFSGWTFAGDAHVRGSGTVTGFAAHPQFVRHDGVVGSQSQRSGRVASKAAQNVARGIEEPVACTRGARALRAWPRIP